MFMHNSQPKSDIKKNKKNINKKKPDPVGISHFTPKTMVTLDKVQHKHI